MHYSFVVMHRHPARRLQLTHRLRHPARRLQLKHVREAEVLVLIQSKGVLTRPWVLVR